MERRGGDSTLRRWGLPALIILGGLGCFAGGVSWTVRRMYRGMEWELRRNDVHRLALQAAESSPRAVELLGTPLSSRGLTLQAHGRTPEANRVDFDLEVEGPKGRGVLKVEVGLSGRTWKLYRLRLEPAAGGAPVELPAGATTPLIPPR